MFGLAFRALLLDGSVYEEIRERQETMFSALGIVILAGCAVGLAFWLSGRELDSVGLDQDELLGLAMSVSTIMSGWFVWTVFVWLLGIRLFQGDTGFRGALRALGVCSAPLILSVFHVYAPLITLVGVLWVLVSGVVAVKNTCDFEWWKAGIAATVGWGWAIGFSGLMLLFYHSAPA